MPRARASRGLAGVVLTGVIALTVHGVYVGSYFGQLTGTRGARTSGIQVEVARGRVVWTRWQPVPGTPIVGDWSWAVGPSPAGGAPAWWIPWTPTPRGAGVLPLWAPVVLSCALLALALRRWTPEAGTLCRSCGYDCSGIRSDRCPECGTLRGPCASSTSQRD